MTRLPRRGPRHTCSLLAALGVLLLCLAARGLSHDRRSVTPGNYEGTWPGKADVLAYLAEQSVTPSQVEDLTGRPQPFGIEKGRIESLEIRRDGPFFTFARFHFVTDRRSYAMDALINHNPVDGMNVFDRVQVLGVSPR